MSKRTPYNLPPSVIAGDRAVVAAVSSLHDYTPASLDLSAASLRELDAALATAKLAADEAQRVAVEARERYMALAWALHDASRRVKHHVKSQYGVDSVTVHAVGLKRLSDHRRTPRRSRPEEEQQTNG